MNLSRVLSEIAFGYSLLKVLNVGGGAGSRVRAVGQGSSVVDDGLQIAEVSVSVRYKSRKYGNRHRGVAG